MKILAIDTSTASGSIALLDDDQIIAELTTCTQKTHVERLLPLIKTLLSSINTKIEDVDGFALTIGPGSFTGLRIGLAAIKGLAWSLNKPVVGVSTLEALAMNIPYSDKPICPILDARKKEVYAGIYKVDGHWPISVMPDLAISPEALVEKIKEPTIFIGDGIKIISELKSEIANRKSQIVFAPSHLWSIKALNIGLLAWKRFKKGDAGVPEKINLNYLRP
ncbi:MAG: tRNA (adenosine(37)-N6)-threonylcarbamoyltransferase complex dimerization subunit type 1 TsaB [Deltaproteobacteria bacterium]